jgi:hypothetical protein
MRVLELRQQPCQHAAMRRYAALALLAFAVAPTTDSGAGTKSPLPAPIALSGVGGVAPNMSLAQVQRAWRIRLPFVAQLDGSSTGTSVGVICSKGVRGAALFHGPDSSPSDTLLQLWFVAGEKTDTGITIGSTVAALRSTYGSSLAYHDLGLDGIRGYWIVSEDPSLPRRAIVFAVSRLGPARGRVVSIGFGYRSEIKDAYPVLDVSC